MQTVEEGDITRSVKASKRVLVMLACSILVFAITGSEVVVVRVQAAPFPWEPLTISVVTTADPYYGPFGGYHDIWSAIQLDLAEIGINLVVYYYDEWTWRQRVFETGWNLTSAEGGWDVTMLEWWMMPTGLIPLESLVHSSATPPNGSNVMSWSNEEADTLLWYAMRTTNPTLRNFYLTEWRRQFLHDPPLINLYKSIVYEATGRYVEGWDPIVRFHDVSNLYLNNTMLITARPDRTPNILIYGVVEPLWNLNPLFTTTPTQERLNLLTHDTLYALSAGGMKPDLAAAPPTLLTGPNGPNTRVRVPLRANVDWSDSCPFNATDVKWTFDLILNPATGASAYGDFRLVLESVEYLPGPWIDPYTGAFYNSSVVDFILYEPYPDFATLLGIPGAAIVPWHTLKDVPPDELKTHPSNWDSGNPASWLPVTGPFNMTACIPDDHITLAKNPSYYGYNASIVNPTGTPLGPSGEPYWGPYNISTLIFQWIWNPAARLIALRNNDIDFCQPIAAPIETFEEIKNYPAYPFLRVWQYNRPTSNLLLFNLNHPVLSNRYVRQAIAHAINYTRIYRQILPTWGVLAIPGNTPVPYVHQPSYWKGNFSDYARSGMPDFDQHQNGTYEWVGHCAPVSVADSLWWYDSSYETNTLPPPAIIDNFNLTTAYGPWDDHDPQNVQPFVEHLAYLMDTHGNRTKLFDHYGTLRADIETGITQYLSWSGVNPQGDVNGDGVVGNADLDIVNNAMGTSPGTWWWDMRADIWPVTTGWPLRQSADNVVNASDLALVMNNFGNTGLFYVHTIPVPNFFTIAEEVERSQDVLLSIGYYNEIAPGQYERDDVGHAVTVAGVDYIAMQIAISDPGTDAFEKGWTPGRSPIPHVHPPESRFTTHNNASLVSHDIYNVTFNTVMDMWELVDYSTPPKHGLIEHVIITSSFEDESGSNVYNVTYAIEYMNMWHYSKVGTDWTLGPVGDADFSGFVDLDDFYLWRDEGFGQFMPIPFLPGQDKDPDFDNTGYIEMADFYRWRNHWGFYYPEKSLIHRWSR